MTCVATAADPSSVGRLLTCENPNGEHGGKHHAHAHDGKVHLWGADVGNRATPAPDDDLWRAYQSGDAMQIAAARGRYSAKLEAAGFPGLNDGLPIDPDR